VHVETDRCDYKGKFVTAIHGFDWITDHYFKVKVPPKCVDQIRVVIQQFRVYRRTARELMKLPKGDRVDETLQFYLSLVSYFKDVILAFRREAKDDASSSTSKWRSAYLDYHFALALHDSSFTEETQATALKAMKRTWTHFLEKKAFKDVQQRNSMILASFIRSEDELNIKHSDS
jgi:hypothetical protein